MSFNGTNEISNDANKYKKPFDSNSIDNINVNIDDNLIEYKKNSNNLSCLPNTKSSIMPSPFTLGTPIDEEQITNIPVKLQKKDLINLLLKFFCSCLIKTYPTKNSVDVDFNYYEEADHIIKRRMVTLDIVAVLLMPITVATVILCVPKDNTLYYLPLLIMSILQRYMQTKKARRNRNISMDFLLLGCFILSFFSFMIFNLYPHDTHKIALTLPLRRDHHQLNWYEKVANLWKVLNFMLLANIGLRINQYLCIMSKVQTFKPLSKWRMLWAVPLASLSYVGCIYFCSHYWYQPVDNHCHITEKNMLLKILNLLNHIELIPESQGFDEFVFIVSLLIPKLAKFMIDLDATICQLSLSDKAAVHLKANKNTIQCAGTTSLKIVLMSVLLILPGYLAMKVLSNCTPLSTLFLSAITGLYIEPIIKFSLQLLLNPDRKICCKDSRDSGNSSNCCFGLCCNLFRSKADSLHNYNNTPFNFKLSVIDESNERDDYQHYLDYHADNESSNSATVR